MNTAVQLEQQLMSIHRKSYPAYKSLSRRSFLTERTKGSPCRTILPGSFPDRSPSTCFRQRDLEKVV